MDGIPQLLEHGKAGILTLPPRDPSSLACDLDLLRVPEQIATWKVKSQLRIENLTIDRVAARDDAGILTSGGSRRVKMAAAQSRFMLSPVSCAVR